ncbi:MAG: hypothetical protein ACPHY8_00795 [Patescibacteria group bacterium]
MKANKNTKRLATIFTDKSIFIPAYAGRGEINPVAHRIHNVLKIFEPTTEPTAISVCFFSAATTQTANSGREVPIATIVTQIKASGNQNCVAIETALSTIIFPQPINPANHNKI